MDYAINRSQWPPSAFTDTYFIQVENKIVFRFFDMPEQTLVTAAEKGKRIWEKRTPISNIVEFSSDTSNCSCGRELSVSVEILQVIQFLWWKSIKLYLLIIHYDFLYNHTLKNVQKFT